MSHSGQKSSCKMSVYVSKCRGSAGNFRFTHVNLTSECREIFALKLMPLEVVLFVSIALRTTEHNRSIRGLGVGFLPILA